MKQRSIFTLIFLSFILFSQGQSFGELHTITSGKMDSSADDIHTADIDNDGDMDIITSSKNSIYLLENKGDNEFEIIRELFSTEPGASQYLNKITTADINNDGLLDIVYSRTYYWDQLKWLENTGDNTFKDAGKIFSFSGAGWRGLSYSLCELNDDGLVDVVIGCNENDLGLEILINNGDATFDHKYSLLEEGTEQFHQCIDMDNDGDIDILYKTKYPYKTAIFLNNGIGEFTEDVIVHNDSYNMLKHAYAFDSDGDSDIDIFTLSSNDSLELLLNNGDLLFDETVVINDTIFQHRYISGFDFENDGDTDLISTSMQILQNLGNNSFALIELGVLPSYSNNYTTSDVNNNGKEDFIYEDKHGAIFMIEDIDTTNLSNWTTLTSQVFCATYPDYKKINNDEYPDICIMDKYYKYVFYINNGNGNFNDTITIKVLHKQCEGTAYDDFNNDGFCDIVSFSDYVSEYFNDSSNIKFAKNNGDNTFTTVYENNYNNLSKYYSPLFTDYDNDGISDLLFIYSQNEVADTILFTKINTDFSVSSYDTVVVNQNININSILFFDIDNNGQNDMIINTGKTLMVNYSFNENFGDEFVLMLTTSNSMNNLSFAQIDNNPMPDIVFAHNDYITVIENIDENSFEQSYDLHITANANKIYVKDINNDSIDEVFFLFENHIGILSSIQNNAYVYEEHDYNNKPNYAYKNSFLFFDIDMDGDTDFLCTDYRYADISWLENDYSPDFIEESFLTQELTIYPNPVNDNLNVVINKTLNTDCELLVFNNLGEEIQHYSVQTKQNQLNINTSQLPAGVYYILLKTNNKRQKGQVFIKQ